MQAERGDVNTSTGPSSTTTSSLNKSESALLLAGEESRGGELTFDTQFLLWRLTPKTQANDLLMTR